MKQLALPERPSWGGKRRRAGRKPTGAKAGASHLRRPRFDRVRPVHVTVRVASHVYNLRSRRCFSVLADAFTKAAEHLGVRVVIFSVLGNHVHLIVEAESNAALGQAMKGFGVRVARGLNRVMNRRGRVLADRYHARVLKSPTDTRYAIRYVRMNAVRHGLVARTSDDRFVSHQTNVALPMPETWLLRVGWRRGPPPPD